MRRAAFALWAGAVVVIYYRRAWWMLAIGAWRDWTLADARSTLLPFGLVVLAAGAAVAWGLGGARRRRAVAAISLAALLLAAAGLATGPTRLPFGGEAAGRAAAGIAGSTLVMFAAWGFGAFTWRARRVTSPEDFVFQLAVGLGAIAGLSGGLALAGWYTTPAVRAVLVFGAGAGVIRIWLHRGRGAPLTATAQEGGPGPLAPAGADRCWFAITVLALATGFAGALAPETEYDALWYHLWLPRQWLLHGAAYDSVHEYVALYPLTWDLVFGAGLATGGPVAAKLLHFACLPLLALTAWQATRRFFPSASPWMAAAVTITPPTVVWEATTAYIDLALAFYVALALYALMAWRQDGRTQWFWVGALCLGLGAAVKHLGLVAVMLAAALIVAMRDETAVGGGPPPKHWARNWFFAAALVLTALIVAAPWYVRAWQASGNPVFPELFELFGARPSDRWDAITERGLDGFKSRFGVPGGSLHLTLLPWTMTMQGARFGGSLGPVFLIFLPLAAWSAWQDRRARWLALFSAGYLVVWASPLSSFQLRFLVPIVLPLSVLVSRGAALAFGERGEHLPRRTAVAGLGLVLVANLPPFIPLHEGERESVGWLTHVAREVPLKVVLGRQSEDEYLRERVPSYGAWQHLRTAPQDTRVLVAGSRHNFYATREPLSVEATAARPVWSEDPQRVTAGLQALSVGYVLVERQWLRTLQSPLPALATEAYRREQLALVYADGHALVYAVAPEQGLRAAPGAAMGQRGTCDPP